MVLQIALVLLFGMLTAYIDIDSFFREKSSASSFALLTL